MANRRCARQLSRAWIIIIIALSDHFIVDPDQQLGLGPLWIVVGVTVAVRKFWLIYGPLAQFQTNWDFTPSHFNYPLNFFRQSESLLISKYISFDIPAYGYNYTRNTTPCKPSTYSPTWSNHKRIGPLAMGKKNKKNSKDVEALESPSEEGTQEPLSVWIKTFLFVPIVPILICQRYKLPDSTTLIM